MYICKLRYELSLCMHYFISSFLLNFRVREKFTEIGAIFPVSQIGSQLLRGRGIKLFSFHPLTAFYVEQVISGGSVSLFGTSSPDHALQQQT